MNWFGIAFIIAVVAVTLGIFMILVIKPKIKEKANKKWILHICNISFVIGLAIYISFLICGSKGKHYDSTKKYIEYPIQKLTLNKVYFNGRGGDNFNESWIVLENPENTYQNVVVEEKEYYTLHWLFKIKTNSSKYHVYLSEEIYDRFHDGDVIYKSE